MMKLSLAAFAATAAFAVVTVTAFNFAAVHRRRFLAESVAIASASSVGSILLPPSIATAEDSSDPYTDFVTTDTGLKYKVIKEGSGATPEVGQTVKAHYTGWLDGFNSGKKFDSSRDRGRPFSFRVGAGQVIRGWDECFSTMKVGERRQVVIPARLGYGEQR